MVPALVFCLYLLTLYPSVYSLAQWLMTSGSLAITALADSYNPLPYGPTAHICSKHPSPINMILNAAFHNCCISALSVPFVLLHRISASLKWIEQAFLYHTASASSCPYVDAVASSTPPAPSSNFLLFPSLGYLGSCP